MSTATLSPSTLAVSGGTPVSAKPIPFMSTALTEQDIADFLLPRAAR